MSGFFIIRELGEIIMPYYRCPICNKSSYTSADVEVWTCPYCKEKIEEKEKKKDKDKD